MALKETEKAGSVVRLKTGSPDLTIESTSLYDGKYYAHCVWFTDDGLLQRGYLPCDVLVIAPSIDELKGRISVRYH